MHRLVFAPELDDVEVKVLRLTLVRAVRDEDLRLHEVGHPEDGLALEGEDLPHRPRVELDHVGQVGEDVLKVGRIPPVEEDAHGLAGPDAGAEDRDDLGLDDEAHLAGAGGGRAEAVVAVLQGEGGLGLAEALGMTGELVGVAAVRGV